MMVCGTFCEAIKIDRKSPLKGQDRSSKWGHGTDKWGCGTDKWGCGTDKWGCGTDKWGCGTDKWGCGTENPPAGLDRKFPPWGGQGGVNIRNSDGHQ